MAIITYLLPAFAFASSALGKKNSIPVFELQ